MEGLFEGDKIKDTVTQDDIDNAAALVDGLSDSDLKNGLEGKLKEAQKQLEEREFISGARASQPLVVNVSSAHSSSDSSADL